LASPLVFKSLKAKIHKILILPVVLYGYGTWTFTLREEHRLRVLKDRELRICRPKGREVVGDRTGLYNEELHSSPNNIWVIILWNMRWAEYVACMREMRDAYKIFVAEPEVKIPLGRLGRRHEDNINIDLRQIGWEGANWMHLTQDKDQLRDLSNTVMNF
jgi:hypothetical protein